MKTAQEKYSNDPYYRTLVDQMVSIIETAQFTPSEMREAATFASYLHEMRSPLPSFIYVNRDRLEPSPERGA